MLFKKFIVFYFHTFGWTLNLWSRLFFCFFLAFEQEKIAARNNFSRLALFF